MPPRIKLIAVDLDGTLLTSAGAISPHTVAVLREATQQRVKIVLVTARRPSAALPFAHQLELTTPLIATNGAQVWASPQGPPWAEHLLTDDVTQAITTHAASKGWPLSFSRDEATGCVYRMLCHDPHAIAALHSLCDDLPGCRTELFYNRDGSLHALLIAAPQANKRTALTYVLDQLKVKKKNVLAIGDNHNDIPMFSLAQTSVAMGNAPVAVRVSATAVAPTNDQDGVAWAVDRFVLGA